MELIGKRSLGENLLLVVRFIWFRKMLGLVKSVAPNESLL